MRSEFIEKRYWVVYVVWIAISAAMVGGTVYLPDASRPSGRLDTEEASKRALEELHEMDPQRFGAYDVVAVAGSGRGELGPEARWVVLCDRSDRSALSEAVVVELDAGDFRLIRVRKPER